MVVPVLRVVEDGVEVHLGGIDVIRGLGNLDAGVGQ